jgi:hypothetical protein
MKLSHYHLSIRAHSFQPKYRWVLANDKGPVVELESINHLTVKILEAEPKSIRPLSDHISATVEGYGIFRASAPRAILIENPHVDTPDSIDELLGAMVTGEFSYEDAVSFRTKFFDTSIPKGWNSQGGFSVKVGNVKLESRGFSIPIPIATKAYQQIRTLIFRKIGDILKASYKTHKGWSYPFPSEWMSESAMHQRVDQLDKVIDNNLRDRKLDPKVWRPLLSKLENLLDSTIQTNTRYMVMDADRTPAPFLRVSIMGSVATRKAYSWARNHGMVVNISKQLNPRSSVPAQDDQMYYIEVVLNDQTKEALTHL